MSRQTPRMMFSASSQALTQRHVRAPAIVQLDNMTRTGLSLANFSTRGTRGQAARCLFTVRWTLSPNARVVQACGPLTTRDYRKVSHGV